MGAGGRRTPAAPHTHARTTRTASAAPTQQRRPRLWGEGRGWGWRGEAALQPLRLQLQRFRRRFGGRRGGGRLPPQHGQALRHAARPRTQRQLVQQSRQRRAQQRTRPEHLRGAAWEGAAAGISPPSSPSPTPRAERPRPPGWGPGEGGSVRPSLSPRSGVIRDVIRDVTPRPPPPGGEPWGLLQPVGLWVGWDGVGWDWDGLG